MSTNDTVLILANGMAESSLRTGKRLQETFQRALDFVCLELAKMIVATGGVTRFIP
jgi:N-acetylglutamate synthase/N-acetylornithine aminotransferase